MNTLLTASIICHEFLFQMSQELTESGVDWGKPMIERPEGVEVPACVNEGEHKAHVVTDFDMKALAKTVNAYSEDAIQPAVRDIIKQMGLKRGQTVRCGWYTAMELPQGASFKAGHQYGALAARVVKTYDVEKDCDMLRFDVSYTVE